MQKQANLSPGTRGTPARWLTQVIPDSPRSPPVQLCLVHFFAITNPILPFSYAPNLGDGE